MVSNRFNSIMNYMFYLVIDAMNNDQVRADYHSFHFRAAL